MVETIENDWDALFRDYPEIYDEFVRVQSGKADGSPDNQRTFQNSLQIHLKAVPRRRTRTCWIRSGKVCYSSNCSSL